MTTATTVRRPSYTYTYVEPHPSLPSSHKLSTGRGGAGNATRLCPITTTAGPTATGPASRSGTVAPRRIAVGGRGGAGNAKPASKVQADEATGYQLEHDARHDAVNAIEGSDRVWHYGRGGHGNVLRSNSRPASDASSLASRRASRRGSVVSSVSASSDRAAGDSAAALRPHSTSRSGSFVDRLAGKLRRASGDSAN